MASALYSDTKFAQAGNEQIPPSASEDGMGQPLDERNEVEEQLEQAELRELRELANTRFLDRADAVLEHLTQAKNNLEEELLKAQLRQDPSGRLRHRMESRMEREAKRKEWLHAAFEASTKLLEFRQETEELIETIDKALKVELDTEDWRKVQHEAEKPLVDMVLQICEQHRRVVDAESRAEQAEQKDLSAEERAVQADRLEIVFRSICIFLVCVVCFLILRLVVLYRPS